MKVACTIEACVSSSSTLLHQFLNDTSLWRIPAIPPEIDLLNLRLHCFTAANPAPSPSYSPPRVASPRLRLETSETFQIGGKERANGWATLSEGFFFFFGGGSTSELVSNRGGITHVRGAAACHVRLSLIHPSRKNRWFPISLFLCLFSLCTGRSYLHHR